MLIQSLHSSHLYLSPAGVGGWGDCSHQLRGVCSLLAWAAPLQGQQALPLHCPHALRPLAVT